MKYALLSLVPIFYEPISPFFQDQATTGVRRREDFEDL
jgi:hypothetical protein